MNIKKRKYVITFILILSLLLSSCNNTANNIDDTLSKENPIRIATLAGPSSMGLIELIDDTSGMYDVSIYTSPDQIVPKIINNEVDIATIPSNLAAVLYQKTQGAISILSLNGLGVLYLVENGNTVNSITDLEGKTIFATGQGATPEYVLNNILTANEINADVQFLAQHSDLANQVASGAISLALLPEPFVSTVLEKNPDVKIKLAISDEWSKIYGDEIETPMTVTIANNEYLSEHPTTVQTFLKNYKLSVDYVNSNIDEAAKLITKHKILGSESIAKSAIPRCSISFITGEDMIIMLKQYFDVLYSSNPQSVGGAIPNEDIYNK